MALLWPGTLSVFSGSDMTFSWVRGFWDVMELEVSGFAKTAGPGMAQRVRASEWTKTDFMTLILMVGQNLG